MFKNSKINHVVLVGLLCGIFLPIVITYIFFINNYKERSAQTMNIITQTISLSASEALWFFSEEWTEVVLNSAVKNSKVYSATIHNAKKILLSHKQETQLVSNTKKITVNLNKKEDFLGTLTLVFNMDEINKDIYIEKNNLLWILLFQAVVSAVTLYFIIKYKVLNPIRRLMYQAKLLSNKKLNKKFDWEQKDEIGKLGNAMNKTRISLKKMFSKLESQAIYDNLTQAYNRYGFESVFDSEVKRCNRYNRPISMIMFDIDFFKKVNDTYGHLAGDKVLIGICDLIQNQIRESDSLIRWGGEEFLVITPEIDLKNALQLAEKIRRVVDETTFETIGHITISLAVAQKSVTENNEDFLKRVDDLLYNSKNSGRNKISH